jgi:hypothetical protein
MVSALVLSAAGAASATPITYTLSYSGSPFGNSATAVGTITLDDALLPNPGSQVNVTAATLGITDFSITVSGASSGNGTFGLAQVTNWIWIVSAPINLQQQLVGQAGFSDFNWCGFLFDGCTAPAPGGTSPFVISANAETGDLMQLVSMEPSAIPEPTTIVLLGAGLCVVAVRRRRLARASQRPTALD